MSHLRVAIRFCCILMTCSLPAGTFAAELPIVRFEAPTGKAFDVIVEGETQSVSLAEIEGLGVYRTRTTTPWERGELLFEGPLLANVVKYIGLGDAPAIRIRALDGFTTDIPREDWLEGSVLLATRRDGKLLTRRDQGPVRVVYPQINTPAFATPLYKPRWIWLIATIEAVN